MSGTPCSPKRHVPLQLPSDAGANPSHPLQPLERAERTVRGAVLDDPAGERRTDPRQPLDFPRGGRLEIHEFGSPTVACERGRRGAPRPSRASLSPAPAAALAPGPAGTPLRLLGGQLRLPSSEEARGDGPDGGPFRTNGARRDERAAPAARAAPPVPADGLPPLPPFARRRGTAGPAPFWRHPPRSRFLERPPARSTWASCESRATRASGVSTPSGACVRARSPRPPTPSRMTSARRSGARLAEALDMDGCYPPPAL